jgi:hypothetical protein
LAECPEWVYPKEHILRRLGVPSDVRSPEDTSEFHPAIEIAQWWQFALAIAALSEAFRARAHEQGISLGAPRIGLHREDAVIDSFEWRPLLRLRRRR